MNYPVFLKELAEKIGNAADVTKKIREDFVRETFSHLVDRYEELKANGTEDNDIKRIITEEWGVVAKIGKTMAAVHPEQRVKRLLVIAAGVWVLTTFTSLFLEFNPIRDNCSISDLVACRDLVLMAVTNIPVIMTIAFALLTPFSWFYWGTLLLMYIALRKLVYATLTKSEARKKIALYISLGVICEWWSIFLSSVGYYAAGIHTVLVGWPVKIFHIPTTISSADTPPTLEWLLLALSLIFWTIIAGVVLKIIPESIKNNNKYIIASVIYAGLLSCAGLTLVLLMYD